MAGDFNISPESHTRDWMLREFLKNKSDELNRKLQDQKRRKKFKKKVYETAKNYSNPSRRATYKT